MKRYRCLLLDANVIIALFEMGLWPRFITACDVTITQTVVDEANYFVDEQGVERAIDLQPDIDAARITIVSVVREQSRARGLKDRLSGLGLKRG
jgi:hypothetical protein